MVSSLGGVGRSNNLTTPGLLFRGIDEKAIMVVCDGLVVCDGQVARLLVFIRNYCENIYSKRIPPVPDMAMTIYYAYIGALIIPTLFDPITMDPFSA